MRRPPVVPDPASILLADDDASFRETLRRVLEEEGYAVTEACNGVEAIELLAAAADGIRPVPDVVVLDVCMPGYSGLGVLSVMRRFQKRPRAIVVTGNTDPSVQGFARRLGAIRVVHKPIDLDLLLAEILAAARAPA
jgi:CheY-like chemotaxis protein